MGAVCTEGHSLVVFLEWVGSVNTYHPLGSYITTTTVCAFVELHQGLF